MPLFIIMTSQAFPTYQIIWNLSLIKRARNNDVDEKTSELTETESHF